MPTQAERERNTRWSKYRNLRISRGTWQPFAAVAPVQDHIQTLRASGMSVLNISDLSGLPVSTVDHIAWPSPSTARTKIRRETAEAILAVQPDPMRLPDTRLIDGTGTRRRIQALARIGWSFPLIAEWIGVPRCSIQRTGHQRLVTVKRAREIADVYSRLHMTPGPSKATVRRAIKAGWAPPLAFDDIDDPQETPKGVAGRAA